MNLAHFSTATAPPAPRPTPAPADAFSPVSERGAAQGIGPHAITLQEVAAYSPHLAASRLPVARLRSAFLRANTTQHASIRSQIRRGASSPRE